MDSSQKMLLDGSGELTHSVDDDCLLDAPLLPSQKLQSIIRPAFYSVPTVSISILLLLIQVAFVALACVAVFFCTHNEEQDVCEQYVAPFLLSSSVIIAKVLLWLLHVITERYIQYHHCKVKCQGYLHLYHSTKLLKTLPLAIHSAGNAAILVIVSAKEFLTTNNLYLYLILGVLILELILSVIFILMYTVQIYKFNRKMPQPDIIAEEHIHSFEDQNKPGIGFGEGKSLENVVERQGDTIEYLKRHNAVLCQQILNLTPKNGNDGS